MINDRLTFIAISLFDYGGFLMMFYSCVYVCMYVFALVYTCMQYSCTYTYTSMIECLDQLDHWCQEEFRLGGCAVNLDCLHAAALQLGFLWTDQAHSLVRV